MLASFNEISKNSQRDEIDETKPNDKEVAHLLKENSSTTKQIFTFLYKNIFQKIDGSGGESFGHIDVMGEMYSEFLKYALGDGKELGIVLTPPYITKMMAEILDINKDNRVMDLATGSAGFLISAMQIMIENANENYAKGSSEALKKIDEIKRNQLLGVELNAEMYTLAATNMILRGDGSARIEHGSAFNRPDELYSNFKADRILLNPPFTFEENGMPFIAYGLDRMAKGGLGAIIIQDSAGSGKAVKSNQQILKSHTLLASIKMPVDLFVPVAGVQTSIYIFKAHEPHDFERSVKFIDFRNDGYKRTSRSLQELDEPTQRYADIVKIYKAGRAAKVSSQLWNLDEIYVEDFITGSGTDWNFDQHKKIDAMPTLADFKKTVSDYLTWEVAQILKKDSPKQSLISERIANLEREFKASGGKFGEFRIGDLFCIQTPKRKFDANKIQFGGQYPYVARGDKNNGIRGYINESTQYLNDENTISFGQDTATMFFQRDKYFTGDKIKIFKPINFCLNSRLANYIIASMRRGFSNFAWGSSSFNVGILKEVKIILPTLGGEINFSFMEKFIEELERERVEELERERVEELDAYLAATGLKDYKLTEKEEDALAKFDEFSKWGGVAEGFENKKAGNLFSVTSNRQLNKDSFRFLDNGEYPYFTRTVLNNGIAGYVDYLDDEHKIKGHSIAVGMLGMQFFYMDKDFYAGQFTKTLYPKFSVFSQRIAQYFIVLLNKNQKIYQGGLVRDFENLFNKTTLLLPVKDGEIYYEFMENFIKAIEKLVIKNVVLWADKKIEATKKVVAKI